jgi:hypothetical protein
VNHPSASRLSICTVEEGPAGKPEMYEDFSDTSGITEAEDPYPSASRVAHEMDALQASLQVVERNGDREEAKLLGRTYLGRLDPSTVEEKVIEAAIRRILGRSVKTVSCEVRQSPWEAHLADSVALSWLAWAADDNERARDIVKHLRAGQKQKETFSGKSGALHLLTLSFWSEAVLLLAKGDRAGARRYFKRAMELGSQFGTDSHPMISWAYAASFFEP